jgi:hypothetical protein
MTSYLLHERLLLHWIAKNDNVNSNNPVTLDDSLAVHCITCCGEVCKIWRMSIRIKETSSNLEPVRYDMELLDTFDIETDNRASKRLCDWINTLNALALTVQFEGIIKDLKEINAYVPYLSPRADRAFSWTSRVGFVYKAGSATEICVAPLSEIRKAYNKGKIVAEQPIGDKVVDRWDKKGQALEVQITPPEGCRVPGEDVRGSDMPEHTGRGKQVPESSVSLPLRSTGSVWNTQLDDIELDQLSSSALQRIARVLSARLNSGEDDISSAREEDIGSTKKDHENRIIRAQQELTEKGMRMDLLSVWKEMGLSSGDFRKLRVATLRTICDNIGVEGLSSKPTKAFLIRTLEPLLES